jgi:uncharacterized coiled-coil protein SlyX
MARGIEVTVVLVIGVAVSFLARTPDATRVDAPGDGAGFREAASQNGDVNCDGEVQLSDAVFTLNWLFLGGRDPCPIADPPQLLERIAQLETEVAAGEMRIADLEGELAESQEQIAAAQEERAAVQRALKESQSTLAVIQAERDALEQELESTRSALLLCEGELAKQDPALAVCVKELSRAQTALALCQGDLEECEGPISDRDPVEGFVRVSDAEFLMPRFDVAGGQRTTRTYSGLVEIFVRGFGQNQVGSDLFQDASWQFWGSNNQPTHFGAFLRLGSERQILPAPLGRPFQPNSSLGYEAGSLPLEMLAVAYENDSFLFNDFFKGLAPLYNPDHVYHLVIDLLDYEGTLTLGFSDGGVFDNSADSYLISVWQVESVPGK